MCVAKVHEPAIFNPLYVVQNSKFCFILSDISLKSESVGDDGACSFCHPKSTSLF